MAKIRILVVENDSIIRATIVETLTDAGYEVDEAETGDRAVNLLRCGWLQSRRDRSQYAWPLEWL
jgi:CheY-like chemotaxis protein